ncbi:unnamed protein product, partial [Strongylus vulgaris]
YGGYGRFIGSGAYYQPPYQPYAPQQCIGPCINGQCPRGFSCIGEQCCSGYNPYYPPNFYQPYAPTQRCIGPCVNGQCPAGYSCIGNQCCTGYNPFYQRDYYRPYAQTKQ